MACAEKACPWPVVPPYDRCAIHLRREYQFDHRQAGFGVKRKHGRAKGIIVESTCSVCLKAYQWRKIPSRSLRAVCSVECQRILFHRKERHLPPDQEVVRLYVDQKLPTTEIARRFHAHAQGVWVILRRSGVRLRKRTNISQCKIAGCLNPAAKIWHATLKVWYGSRCVPHQKMYKKNWQRAALEDPEKRRLKLELQRLRRLRRREARAA